MYCACRGKKCRLFVDGAATGVEYEEISFPQYSDDGKHLAYLGKRGKKWVALVDGKETGPEMDIFDFRHWGFNPGGSRFYVATSPRVARFHELEWMYVVDGATGPGFAAVSRIAFSRDGKHYAYAGAKVKVGWKDKPRGTLVVDGQPRDTFEGRSFFEGEMVTGALNFVPEFHGISNPEFDPEGKVVYAARRAAGDVAVFVGDGAGPGFDDIVSPVIFSPDGKHFAYVAQQGEDFVEVRDNRPGAKFPGKRAVSFVQWMYVTNEPEHHMAYEIVRGGARFMNRLTDRALRRVVIDGQPGPEYDVSSMNGLRFSKDFAHYGYEIHGIEGKHARVRIDGQESRSYDDVVVWSLTLAAEPGTASFIACDKQKLLRVSLPIH
ncbi:MAG: hypothetical protein LAP21_01375 [Acidobacteriia bacterium]|nr:hypothetical protein [Terriglobia bacterium]